VFFLVDPDDHVIMESQQCIVKQLLRYVRMNKQLITIAHPSTFCLVELKMKSSCNVTFVCNDLGMYKAAVNR